MAVVFCRQYFSRHLRRRCCDVVVVVVVVVLFEAAAARLGPRVNNSCLRPCLARPT